MEERKGFGSTFGFLMAAVGSAVGLGNIWGFPNKMGANGGFTFLLIYLILAALCGFVVMVGELALGRKTGRGVVSAYQVLSKRFKWLGWLGIIAPFLILSFYCALGGYCIKYVVLNVGNIFGAGFGNNGLASGEVFGNMLTNQLESVIYGLIFVLLTLIIVMGGVSSGIEKFCSIGMPCLFFMLVIVIIRACTLPGAVDGLKYMFVPGWAVEHGVIEKAPSIITVLSNAGGQMFFSLSLGMGIMITYGSYVKDDVNLSKSINQIEIFDTGVAFLSGLMIIPAVFVFLGTDGMTSGPSLTFLSLPKVFASMGAAGRFVGIAFFLMLGFAALTSCVSVMETLVANCMELFHKSRKKMCVIIGTYSLVTAVIICLGYNVFYFDLKLPNGSVGQLLDLADYISNSFLMPFISLLTSILIGWVIGPKWITDEVTKNGESFKREKLYGILMRYVVPVVMLVLFFMSTGLWDIIF